MQGDVLLKRRGGRTTARPVTIRTERMTAVPDEERFSSDVPVLIEQGGTPPDGRLWITDNLTRVLTGSGRLLRGEMAPARR